MQPTFDTLLDLLPEFERSLKKSVNFKPKDSRCYLEKAIHHAVLSPGKRIRPLICMATEKSLSNNIGVSMVLAIAIELIHCYSLIHDDLPAMDNDDYRRGQLSCHKKFGEDIAILAGDTLNSYVFEYLSTHLLSHTNATTSLKIIQLFSKTCGLHGMSGGQVLDLKSSSSEDNNINDLEKIHSLKTGAIIESCFTLPSMVLTKNELTLSKIKRIGYHYGMLFQIVDDILDTTATISDIGKSPGKDAKQNKLTYISLLGKSGALAEATSHKKEAINLIKTLDLKYDYLSPIFEETYHKGQKFCY